MHRQNWLRVLVVTGVAGVVAAAGCSRSSDEPSAVSDSRPTAPATDASSPIASDTVPSATPVDSTEPATIPATNPPETNPPQTDPPDTEAPTTTIDTGIQVVGPWTPALEAVGTSSGDATAAIQYRLLQLGFWNGGADGQYGLTTKQAVMAFQKYLGLPATGSVDADTAAWMSNITEKPRGKANSGTIIEIDKTRQLLFIVIDGVTQWTLNVSTGNGEAYEEPDQNTPGEVITGVSLTPDGVFEVDREREEGWWEGDLGEIYRPKYFRGGIAVHGSNSIPNYPASHGCVRVSVPAMDWIWEQNLMPIGTTVWVHNT